MLDLVLLELLDCMLRLRVQVEEIGGVPISELQRSIKGLRGGR